MSVVVDPCAMQKRRTCSPAGRINGFDTLEISLSAPQGYWLVLYIFSCIGGRQLVFIAEIIFEGTPQVMGDAFVFRPVLLQNIVFCTVHGRFCMHIFCRTSVTVIGRVGEVGGILLSGIGQIHQCCRRKIPSLFSCQRYFSFQDIRQAPVVLNNHIDRCAPYAVLRWSAVHHFYLFYLGRRSCFQHVGQLFRCH